MPQEYIEIRGARENNLKIVSLRIPKRKITIFTGVSGSGKSSIRKRCRESFKRPSASYSPRAANVT
jgi:excinuclease UvrABC ATPase subunit